MSSNNLVTQARLAQAAYHSNNRSDTATIDGWRPIWVNTQGLTLSESFGAQLYERDGLYTLAFRGTQGALSDWAQNIRYGIFEWSDEFGDTLMFSVRALQQIAQQTQSTLKDASQWFQTTGHSQGGFEAELASTLLGLPGVSFDGMGALGVSQQFHQLFEGLLQNTGAESLLQQAVLKSEDFLTRIYSVVGRLGLHSGTTENAWSWGLTQATTLLHPMTGVMVGASMLVAHNISHIISNETLRTQSKIWHWLGQSELGVEDEASWMAQQMVHDLQAVAVASNDPWLPALVPMDAMQASLLEFLLQHQAQGLSIEQAGQVWWVTADATGDVWRGFADGSWLSVTSGDAGAQTLVQHSVTGELIHRVTQHLTPEGWTVLQEDGPQGQSIAVLQDQRWTVTLVQTDGHAEQQTWMVQDDLWVMDERWVTAYSAKEIQAAQEQALMSALGLIQSLRLSDAWGSLAHLAQLSHQVQILAQQTTRWGNHESVLIGALNLIRLVEQWDDASHMQKVGLLAQTALSSNQVLQALHPEQQGGFVGSNAGIAALQGVAAWSQLATALQSGNPLLLGQSFVAIQQSAFALGWYAEDVGLDLGSWVAVELAKMVLSDWMYHPPESAAAPPLAQMRVDASGAWVSDGATDPMADGELGLHMLSALVEHWSDALQAQAQAQGLHLVAQRLPVVRLEGFPSFDRHGIDNYIVSVCYVNQVTGQTQGLLVHAIDAEAAFFHAALSAGSWVNATEAATLQAKAASGLQQPYWSWGQWLVQQGIEPLIQASDWQQLQVYSLLAIDLGQDGIQKRARDVASGLTVSAVLADSEMGIARADVDHDGFLERTQWLEPNDGLLAIDLNADGWLIGSDEWLINKPLHSLAYWDVNADGWLNAADPVFDDLYLWIDWHADARHNPGEAWPLSALGATGVDWSSGRLVFGPNDSLPIDLLSLEAEVQGIRLTPEQNEQGQTILGQFTWQIEGNEPLLAVIAADSSVLGVSVWTSGQNHAPVVNATTRFTVPEDGIWSNHQDPHLRRRLWLPDFLTQVQAHDAEGSPMAFGDFSHLEGIERVERIDDGVMVTLDAHYSGDAGFEYRVTDGQGGWTAGEIRFDVVAQNDAPWLTGLPGWPKQTAELSGWFETRIFAFDWDDPLDHLQLEILQHPIHGNLSLSEVTWDVWQGTRLVSGHVAGQWDVAYRFRYGDPYSGPVQATLQISDASGASTVSGFQTLHQGSQALRSGKPVAIDWNQDGLLSISSDPSSRVLFDMNATGNRQLMSWLGNGDAWLAMDLNQNERIDDGSELSFMGLDPHARTDLEGLLTWDANADGWINDHDPMWTALGVWHDVNANAVSDPGEWASLASMGWQGVSVLSNQVMEVAGDAIVFGSAVARDERGQNVTLWDVALPMWQSDPEWHLPTPVFIHDWVRYWNEQALLLEPDPVTQHAAFWQNARQAAEALGVASHPVTDPDHVLVLA